MTKGERNWGSGNCSLTWNTETSTVFYNSIKPSSNRLMYGGKKRDSWVQGWGKGPVDQIWLTSYFSMAQKLQIVFIFIRFLVFFFKIEYFVTHEIRMSVSISFAGTQPPTRVCTVCGCFCNTTAVATDSVAYTAKFFSDPLQEKCGNPETESLRKGSSDPKEHLYP